MADRVLLIDDSDLDRAVTRRTLEQFGYLVEEAPSGQDGILRARAVGPDLVLVDLRMPDLDGLETTRELRADSRTQHIPIVIQTSETDPASIGEAFSAGADDYVVKPASGPELRARVQSRIGVYRMRRELADRARLSELTHRIDQSLLDSLEQSLGSSILRVQEQIARGLGARSIASWTSNSKGARSPAGPMWPAEGPAATRLTMAGWNALLASVEHRLSPHSLVVVDDVYGIQGISDEALSAAETSDSGRFVAAQVPMDGQSMCTIAASRSSADAPWSQQEIEFVRESARQIAGLVERAASRGQLHEARKNFAQLVTNIKQALFVVDVDSRRITFANPEAARLLPWAVDGGRWSDILDRIHAHDREHVAPRALAPGLSSRIEVRMRDVGTPPSERWMAMSSFPIEDHEQDRVAVVLDDVNDRKRAEIQLVEGRERELETSARIQQTILIEDIAAAHPLAEAAALTIPSEHVDGDFYEAVSFSDSSVDILIADVMGKGIIGAFWGAALKSQYMRASVEALLRQPDQVPPVEALIAQVHDRLTPSLMDLNSFTTLAYNRFVFNEQRMKFVDCGHTPTLHFHQRTDRCWLLKGRNAPLGFLEDEVFQAETVPYEQGDVFFFYSDGVVEAHNEITDLYGEERLVRVIEHNARAVEHVEELVELVKQDVVAFTQGSGLGDDFSAIAIRCHAPADKSVHEERVAPGVLESIPDLRAWFSDMVSEQVSSDRLDPKGLGAVVLAFSEGLTNVIRHGVPQGRDSSIHVELGFQAAWLFARITYVGDQFDWTTVSVPDVATFQESGYGTFVMHELMDSVTYAHDLRGGMMLTMVKELEVH